MNLHTPIGLFPTVGKSNEKILNKLGIRDANDLIFYFPFRHDDFSVIKSIKDAKDGEQVTIKAQIVLISNKRSFRKKRIITESIVMDDTGQMRVVWYGQPFLTNILKAGDRIYLSGIAKHGIFGVEMVGPVYEKQSSREATHTARIVPVYPLTKGITQKQIRFLISKAVHLAKDIKDWMPEKIKKEAGVIDLSNAIQSLHFPVDLKNLYYARKRMKFDELFIIQLRAELIRRSMKRLKAFQVLFHEKQTREFVSSLPFKLTPVQKRSAWEILQDIQKESPMNRLLEGDVGSGKTIVAAISMYNCFLSGCQSAIMAPTEVLAKQHYESFKSLFADYNLSIGLLTRNFCEMNQNLKDKADMSKKSARKNFCELLKNNKINIIVGTHSLISEGIEFDKLGLAIVDEQHRFGVEQRKSIREKNDYSPHFLSMTATPIPRSFALALYGDLDVSIMNQMPQGRKPIKTKLVSPDNRDKAYEFIRNQIKHGRQAFVICPLIDTDSETRYSPAQEKKTVLEEYEKLKNKIFSEFQVSFLHGKMKSSDKESAMKDFACGKINILVATSVIEVGINVPNASVMMIEGADRFGLAQLHQFRGRVGRSVYDSYCFLFTDTEAQSAIDRLLFFEKTNDGFKVAEYDLETRGPGEVYGTAQSGEMRLKFATMKDIDLIKSARDIARSADFDKYPILKDKVKEWEQSVHLE